MKTTLLVMLVVALMMPAVLVQAESPEPARSGFYIGFGLGGGAATPDKDVDSEAGGTGAFRVGWALTDEVVVGLEGAAWTKEVNGVTWTFSAGGPGITFYPGNMGFFVKAVVGSGQVEVEFPTAIGTFKASDSGLGFMGGLGYEHRLTTKFALGAEADGAFINIDGLDGTRFIGVNIMFNWYWAD